MSFPAMPKAVHQFYAGSLAADAELWGAGFAEDALFHDPVAASRSAAVRRSSPSCAR